MSAVVRGRAALEGITAKGRGWETRHEHKELTRVVHSGEWEGSLSECCDCGVEAGYRNDADAAFIAAAPGLVRDLCDEIDRVETYGRVHADHLESDLSACQANRAHIALQFREMRAERDAALATIERVRALHQPRLAAVADGTRDETICTECGVVTFGQVRAGDWPCGTIQALGDQL